jgi:transcription initiation factor TFIID TATA-box-binding protein
MQKIKTLLPKEIKIRNVVTTADLKQKIDIEKLNDVPWGIYDQQMYHGICGYVKTPDMKGRVTVFSSGKMISIGSNTIEDSIDKLYQAKFYLQKGNFSKEVELYPTVRNTVAVMLFSSKLNLKKVSLDLPNSIYEPDIFPGLRYKIKDGLSILIFSSGKIIIVGGKSISDIKQAYNLVKKILDDV